MNTDELVRALSRDLPPVRRIAGVGARTARLCSSTLALVLLMLAIHGVRADWSRKLAEAPFLREQVALLGLFVAGAYGALHLTVPGKPGARLAKVVPVLVLATWVGLVLARHSPHEALGAPGLKCVARMLGLAALPSVALAGALRRAPPLELDSVALFGPWSACALAMFGTQWLCVRENPLHVLVWHSAPVALSGLIGWAIHRSARA